MLSSLKFRNWAMPVEHRGWAFLSVVLHRLQRMTVLSPEAWASHTPLGWPHAKIRHIPGHLFVVRAENYAWNKATGAERRHQEYLDGLA